MIKQLHCLLNSLNTALYIYFHFVPSLMYFMSISTVKYTSCQHSGALVSTELAASVPRTEIVGKSDYFRFGMRDSLAIEASFLQVIFLNFLLV